MNAVRGKTAYALAGAVAAAFVNSFATANTYTNTSGPVQQGTSDGSNNYNNNNPAVTISFAGQTALSKFDESPGITELAPGTSIVLHDGTDGAPVTYIAPNDSGTFVQLASPAFNSSDINPGTPTSPSTSDIQQASAIALEWHAEGSIDGFYDLINDQIGYAGGSPTNAGTPISNEALRTPSTSNPTYVNTNSFTAAGSKNGFTLTAGSNDILADTYSSTVYNQATGANLLGGQNRVQFSVGEYPTEAFAVSGTASPFATPGSAGYGQGNTALAPAALKTALGTANADQQFQPSSIANEAQTTLDPQTDAAYASGPWNTAGANNITSTPFAATAVTYSANPGTGLERLDLSDTQWLQTTGRLQNGALFNTVARTVDTGQRVVFALNTGIDPSWAVGSNDDGNSTSSTAAAAQHSIGSSLRFDGKTSGSEAEKTIAQSRMGVGALSIPEASGATSNAPIRALDIDFNSGVDPSGAATDSNYIRANFSSIVSSNSSTRYQAVLISHYNTVKSPNQTALNQELTAEDINPATATPAQQQYAWSQVQSYDPTTAETDGTPSVPVSGIKGDTTGDVAAFLSNIINSVGSADAGLTSASVNNPADDLFINGYLTPGLLDWTRTTDGGPITPVTLSSAAQAEQSQVNSNYGNLFTTDNTYASNNQTIGSGATYADGNSSGPSVNGSIPITAKDVTWSGNTVVSWSNASNTDQTAEGGNYLFGNFNQNGVRDYSDVQQAVNAALSLYVYANQHTAGDVSSIFSGAANSTVISSLAGNPGWVQTGTDTKGDLITLGDYNGDGSFNGQDLYLLAIGASLASASNVNAAVPTLNATVTTFSDVVRDPTNVLLKNTALNYINTYLNTPSENNPNNVAGVSAAIAFIRQTAAAVLTGYNSATPGENIAGSANGGINPVTGAPNYIPYGATDLGTTDPITGLEQYSYDPNGANAFNPGDVNRDGTVDFNDAVIVDQFNGQSYENQTQSLAATIQTPVTGATEPVSLVVVQQVDGESAIGSADLAAVNTQLTGTGNTNWYAYTLQKTGPGTITWARTGGTVTVYSGASFEISSGTVQIGGSQDPFTDNNAPGTGSTAGNHVAVTVNNGAKLQYLPNAAPSTVSGLSIDTSTGSQVDVGNTSVTIDYGASDPASTILGYLTSGSNGGAWNGPGINSSVAATNSNYGVGYSDGAAGIDPSLTSGQLEVKYAQYGDITLQGLVNAQDFSIFANNFGKVTTLGWEAGDFLYQGVVNAQDFSLLSANFGQTETGESASLPSADWDAIDAFANANSLSAPVQVPEPASASVLAMTALALLPRRRRRRRRRD